jgi:hypothetical protein
LRQADSWLHPECVHIGTFIPVSNCNDDGVGEDPQLDGGVPSWSVCDAGDSHSSE